MRRGWIVRLFFALIATSANAGEFEYRIHSFRWPSQESCHSHIRTIADRIAEQHHVTVLGAGCERSRAFDATEAIVRYESETPLNLVTTYPLHGYSIERGFYESEQKCLERLTQEIETYKLHTQLQPIHSFCTARRLNDRQPWFAYIDGFGPPSRNPDLFGWSSDRIYSHSEAELFETLRRRLEPRGVWLTHLSWHPAGVLGNVSAFAYFDKTASDFSVKSSVISTIPGLDACRATANDLDKQLTASSSFRQLTSYCSSGFSNPASFSLIALYESRWIDVVSSVEQFSSRESCESSRQVVTGEMRAVRPGIAASVCGLQAHSLPRNDSIYRVIALDPKAF
jgi:hypothetical protein